MSRRKHISWKTKCAAALLSGGWGGLSYNDAKQLTEDQYLSLFQFDHNMLHAFEGEDRDSYYNLTPMLIMAHRRKTKQDAKIIAKSRRLRTKITRDAAGAGNHVARLRPAPLRTDPDEAGGEHFRRPSTPPLSGSHKLRSRGFDKTLRKKVSGKVEKR